MEALRTTAQRSYVGSPQMVYYKSRNRIFFVRNNAPRWGQILFYMIGLPLHLIWFTVMILFHGTKKVTSRWMLVKGTRE
jgi:threonine/homoserine/homoserine lactone efflux protein